MTDKNVCTEIGLTLDQPENRRLRTCGNMARISGGEPVYCRLDRDLFRGAGCLMVCKAGMRSNLLALEVNNDIW